MWAKLKQAPAIISMLIALFTGIRDLIRVVEEDGPEKGGGAEKKDLVLGIIEIIYDLLDNWISLPIEKDFILDGADKLIDLIVKFFNLWGLFKKDTSVEVESLPLRDFGNRKEM